MISDNLISQKSLANSVTHGKPITELQVGVAYQISTQSDLLLERL